MSNAKKIAASLAVSMAGFGMIGMAGATTASAHPGPITGNEIYNSDAECYQDMRFHQTTTEWECTDMPNGQSRLEGKTHAQ
ncbi:hypothetical protein [Nocardia sp. NPDC057440]|uniref:hypothetical protein n=1 Tax=Nocardia sp. NPDC057440 TaxID=3346134 RepID=UPI00366D39EC